MSAFLWTLGMRRRARFDRDDGPSRLLWCVGRIMVEALGFIKPIVPTVKAAVSARREADKVKRWTAPRSKSG
ncbi:MAG: hypothetical protein AAF772_03405 [Acidobacteriota bacterium]